MKKLNDKEIADAIFNYMSKYRLEYDEKYMTFDGPNLLFHNLSLSAISVGEDIVVLSMDTQNKDIIGTGIESKWEEKLIKLRNLDKLKNKI